jgi:5-methylcytosine-specific restriction endonuclease McrBC GTP-binding regulatory subunit McrB
LDYIDVEDYLDNKEMSSIRNLNFNFARIVQFHPSYTYEDFVRGLVAKPLDTGVTFEPQDKIFALICNEAAKKENEDKKFVLIIDEINRADMAKVFGELIYGLEYRTTNPEEGIDTPYEVGGSSKLSIPPNLYIIGTMNTADKSIALLDYAIRRRFAFVPMYPDRNIIGSYYNDEYSDTKIAALNVYDRVKACFDSGKGRDLQVGHTYFMVGEKKKLENGAESKEIYMPYESEKPDAKPIDDNRSMELLKQKFIYETAPIIHEYMQAGEDGLEKKKTEEIEAAYKSDDIVIELAEVFDIWSSASSESAGEETVDTDSSKDNDI